RAQVDPNIQSRIDIYTVPLFPSNKGFDQFGGGPIACLSDTDLVLSLSRKGRLVLPPDWPKDNMHRDDDNQLAIFLKDHPSLAAQILADYFKTHPDGAQRAEEIRKDFFAAAANAQKTGVVASLDAKTKIFIPSIPTPFCGASTSVKISTPLSPTYETNELKSSANGNRNPGESIGLGGLVQVFAPGLAPDQGPFDVMGVGAQSH